MNEVSSVAISIQRLRANRAAHSAAALYEAAGRKGAFPSAIKPVGSERYVCGPALPVLSAPGDNLWIHRAIYAARPGDILVVATSSSYERGYWGEIMTHAALHRHIGGLVIDGCVRDAERLRQLQLPIFARGLCIRGTTKNAEACGSIGLTITVGEVQVSVGDVIFGDEDGIVAIPHHVAPEVLAAAEERAKFETNVISALREGSRTIDIYNLPGSVAERTSDA